MYVIDYYYIRNKEQNLILPKSLTQMIMRKTKMQKSPEQPDFPKFHILNKTMQIYK